MLSQLMLFVDVDFYFTYQSIERLLKPKENLFYTSGEY